MEMSFRTTLNGPKREREQKGAKRAPTEILRTAGDALRESFGRLCGRPWGVLGAPGGGKSTAEDAKVGKVKVAEFICYLQSGWTWGGSRGGQGALRRARGRATVSTRVHCGGGKFKKK